MKFKIINGVHENTNTDVVSFKGFTVVCTGEHPETGASYLHEHAYKLTDEESKLVDLQPVIQREVEVCYEQLKKILSPDPKEKIEATQLSYKVEVVNDSTIVTKDDSIVVDEIVKP